MKDDFLCFSKEPEIISAINSEPILYSNKIQKMNTFLIKQERNFIITSNAIYIFNNKKKKKVIKYEEILGITLSSISNEFIIHRKKQYDIYYLCQDKNKLICSIIKAYENHLNYPIILCEINDKSIKAYATTKKEKKRDIDITRMDKTKIIDTETFLMDNESNWMDIEKAMSFTKNNNDLQLNNNINEINDDNIFWKNNLNIIFCKESSFNNFTERNLNYLGIIGRGKFSKTYLVENTVDKKYYAIKSIMKNNLEEYNKNQIKKILEHLNHNFLVELVFCYETNERIYFLTEYYQNEDLFYHIHSHKEKKNKNLNEIEIKFYSASIILALEYLHKNGIKYRNITPGNILITKDGYIKLTSFSFEEFFNLKGNICEYNLEKNEYSSPEALLNKQNESSDFWNLGIIIFEMIYGITPFYSFDVNNLSEIIEKNKVNFPEEIEISESLKNLIEKLLEKNSDKRFGNINDFSEIKNHEFFKGFNFEDLLNKKIEAPYKPCLDNDFKNKTFEKRYIYEELFKMELIDAN